MYMHGIVNISFNFFFYYYYFPFSHNFFFLPSFLSQNILLDFMWHVEKSHSFRPSRFTTSFWCFYVFFPMPKENSCFHQKKNTTKYTLHRRLSVRTIIIMGYYESKNGEKKAPRKDTQTSVVMGWLLTKTTIMCAHKRSHE